MSRASAGRPRAVGRAILFAAWLLSRAAIAQSAVQQAVPQPREPITLLISLDAFRSDYIQRPAAVHLRALAARGVHAERMVPSFPSKTFPNHYTLVTGLYPAHHGIVANVVADSVLGRFAVGDNPQVRDGRWWGGEPIWVTAERHGVRAAPYFWPGTEAEIAGVRPTFYAKYSDRVSHATRINTVLEWLGLPKARAPRFATIYFSDVDDASHRYGPFTPEADAAIARVDSCVGALVAGIARLGLTEITNIIVVSDHGMAPIAPERTIFLDDFVSLDSLEVIDWTPIAALAPKAGKEAYVYRQLHGAHPHLAVYRKAELPARLHYADGARVPAIIGISDEGWSVTSHARFALPGGKPKGGAHGYDNQLQSMSATFVAAGPGIKTGGITVPAFQNVHVYSLLAELLGVKPAKTDGSVDSVRAILRR